MGSLNSQWEDVEKLKFCGYYGAFAFVEHFVCFPFQLIKTQQQISNDKVNIPSNTQNTNQHIKYLYKSHGIRGFYRGFLFGSVPMIPGDILYYVAYNEAKLQGEHLLRSPSNSNNYIILASSVLCDLSAMLIWQPMDIITNKLMVQDMKHTHISNRWKHNVNTIKGIYNGNFFNFYKGCSLALLMYLPGNCVSWVVYERMKRLLNDESTFSINVQHCISGAFAGAVASLFSHPLDVIKVRYQTGNNTSISHELDHLIRNDGAGGFYRGIKPRLMISMLSSSIMMMMYEKCFALSRKKHVDKEKS